MRGCSGRLGSVIHPFIVYIFLLGASAGFLAALACPRIGELYLTLYSRDVMLYCFQLRVKYGLIGATLAVFSRNMTLAVVLTLAPYFISYSYRNRGEWLGLSLTAFSTCATLAYGFAPYGLILGYLYIRCEVNEFLRWILYLAPHAPLEASAILYSASHSLRLMNVAQRGGLTGKRSVKSISQAACTVLASGILLIAAALLETYISPTLL